MSELLQSGRHPDADQLNAFVEQALPPHEREQILAHLAGCPDCRAVIELSLPPVAETPGIEPEPLHRPWFAGWNLAWPATAALAIAGFVAVHMHNAAISRTNNSVSPQVALSHPPPTVPIPSALPVPANKPAEPSLDRAQVPNQKKSRAVGVTAASQSSSPDTAVLDQNIGSIPLAGHNFREVSPGQPASQSSTATAPSRPSIAAATNGALAGSVSAAGIDAAAAQAQPPAAAASSPPAARDEIEVTSANQMMIATDNALLGETIDARAIASLPAKGMAKQRLLPSRLPVLSMVTNAHQVLAIDSQNTLYLSTDDGKHWHAIPAQWKGKAMKVELASYPVPVGRNSAFMAAKTRAAMQSSTTSTATSAVADANSSLTGIVTDTSGAVIPGASVVLRNTGTTITRTIKTDLAGRYIAAGLSPGTYQIEVQAPGFKIQSLEVTLTASQQSVSNVTLQVGAATQAVTVQASTAPLAESPVTPAGAISLPAQPKASPSVFEITTDSGDRWTSNDGKVWKHK